MDDFASRFSRIPSFSLLLQWTLAVVGAFWLCSKLLSLGRLLQTFILSGTNLRRYGKPGSWAVVTGASDGLGREYATQLAAEGFSLVLISRTKSKLESVAADIEEKYGGKGLEIKILAMDFSKDKEEDYKQLSEMIHGLDIAILINNVGQSHSLPVSFLDTPRSELQDIVTINCLGTLKVTQIVGPILKQRKNGLILTMGSFAGWGPSPFLATYSGSKAFLQQWNNALASELSDDNVDVYLVLSHLVTTSMSKVRRPNYLIPTARDFVKSALGKVGLDGYQYAPSTYTPWWSHAFALWAIENFLGANSPRIIRYSKKVQQNVRSRALRKRDREAKKQ